MFQCAHGPEACSGPLRLGQKLRPQTIRIERALWTPPTLSQQTRLSMFCGVRLRRIMMSSFPRISLPLARTCLFYLQLFACYTSTLLKTRVLPFVLRYTGYHVRSVSFSLRSSALTVDPGISLSNVSVATWWSEKLFAVLSSLRNTLVQRVA